MAKTVSSNRWLARQAKDPYVKAAKQQKYRARAAFKLLQIQEKYKIFRKNQNIVDLGAAPGSWSQVAQELIAPHGRIIAIDKLAMEPLKNVEIVQGDFTEPAIRAQITQRIITKADLILSDMAPNLSGIPSTDVARALDLAVLVVDFARLLLKSNGNLIIKLFQGPGFGEFINQCQEYFTKVIIYKPDASRDSSREVYCIGLGFK